jgi:poly(3-hydroxybutyrate) depolymerase
VDGTGDARTGGRIHPVFPEGVEEMWDDTGRGRRDGVRDDAFARALVGDLIEKRIADPHAVFLVGLSNGGFFAELPVRWLSWTRPGRPPVVLYRIEGGAHGWPGAPQFLPGRLIGRIPSDLDATGILLSFAHEILGTTPRATWTEGGH